VSKIAEEDFAIEGRQWNGTLDSGSPEF